MQAVYNDSASAHLFSSGRDYMMRSEKRGKGAPSGSGRSGAPRRRPPRRRRKRAGFFYKLLTMLLLLLLWPVGLVLLWQRRLRWGVGTKLLTSVVTFAACIILIGFALTVNTGNADYTAMQDRANSFLDVAADALIDAGETAGEQAKIIFEGASDLADAAWQRGRILLADGIDFAADRGAKLRADIDKLIDSAKSKDGDDAPAAEATDEIASEATPSADPTAESKPTARITVGPESSRLPVYLPDENPSAEEGETIEGGVLERGGGASSATLPATREPVITPAPTPEVLAFMVKPAAEAIVYYNNGGKCYHMASSCGSMASAAQHSFGETAESSVRRCSKCGTPDKSILDEEYIVWIDGSRIAHLTDECAAFVTGWNLMTAAQAAEEKITACTVCSADDYLTALANGKQVQVLQPESAEPVALSTETIESVEIVEIAPSIEPTEEPTEAPTQAPTEEPTEAPTQAPIEATAAAATEAPAVSEAPAETLAVYVKPTPTPMMIVPTRALKAVDEISVYLEGESFHLLADCSAIAASASEARLADCAGKTACESCAAMLASFAEEHYLWQDENGLCHTGDDCEAFSGSLTLIPRDEALEQGLSGCKSCKAAEYLFPRTAINYAAIRQN